ncbi:hypothetical protein SAMN04490240_4079 [Rhodococcus pyridinivorans]|uniref:phage terminase small subunit n=1 Tax=Rhodococcus pyridinivorans TaxID=103816 RepID=UPI0007CD97ED|nr:hypothetical protein [Rhodococcus pyridinivorans]SED51385.1 hypothetical protein SAMN04490240_4079 [Rhodococcus pyridinivorans]
MPVPGRKPSADGQKRHRGKSDVDWVEVPDVPYDGERPKLPTTRTVVTRDGQEKVRLQTMTRKWWDTISRMPHCVMWTDSDWMFAITTAMVADAAYCGIASAAVELRNREKVLGTTADFRRDLRIRYVPVEEKSEPAKVTNIDRFRNL